ncbi:MAG: class I SAM-dependent methyltransferase [Candidatus Aureabacteria bacterium]|nr:class I SAM-dependent methyltransferase [Candidatus Auribacterota bacterium]
MNSRLAEYHKKYSERVCLYKKYGYDIEKEKETVLNQALPVSGKILEIGTGKGYFSLCLARHGFKFTTVDQSETEQEFAKAHLRFFNLEKTVIFKKADAGHLDFKNKSFDVIFLINVFHHLEKPLSILDEIVRLLKPGGKTVLSDFNQKGFKIINDIHESEGRKHECLQDRIEEAGDYLIYRGFDVRESQSDFQKIVTAVKIRKNRS